MKKVFISMLSLLLCVVMLSGVIPIAYSATGDGKRSYTRLADLAEMEELLLSDSEARSAEYPNGAMMLAETSAELEMNRTYAIDIFRQGGTKGEASIKLSTVDLTAGYDEAYRLYLSDDAADKGVDGTMQLYYYPSFTPYIARLEEQETYYMTKDNVDDLDEAKQDASEINDYSAESMPHSTETVLTFAEGENQKTVFVETRKPKAVTDDLEFMLVLSDPKNCSISASTSGVYKILEQREKPKAKLEIAATAVNPEDGEAYISVKRSGNLGGYDSFRVTTQSDTAQADEDYVAVAQDLRFIPNVSEIKVPVTILDGAEDGESFKAELSDLSDNAVAQNTTAAVTFDKKQEIVSTGDDGSKKYVTSYTFKSSKYRQYEFVDLTKFGHGTALSDWDDGIAHAEGDRFIVGYDNGWSSRNHAASAKSPEAIDFYGVKDVYMCYDHLTGSTVSDDGAVVIAGSDPLSDGDRECGWMKSKSNCAHWGMGNISSSHITRTLSLSDRSVQNIYLIGHKCGIVGEARVRFHGYNGSADCSFRLNLQDYTVNIIDPDPVQLYHNGKLESVKAVTDSQFTDPNNSWSSYTTRATFYRYDTTTIKANVDSKYGSATFKGIYFVNPDDTSKKSSLVTLSDGQLTLSPDILRSYSSFIRNNKITIQPCYEFAPVNFSVASYEDKETGVKFTADNNNHKGSFTVNGQDYGTVTWSYDSSRNGKYYTGDVLKFTYTPGKYGSGNLASYRYYSSGSKSDLPIEQWNETGSGGNEVYIKIDNPFFSVTPRLNTKATTKLVVTNPDKGGFTSKGTKYAKTNSDGSVIVTGVKGDKLDESFENASPGTLLTFTAKADNKFDYPVWTYTDAVTHQKVTKYGNTFYFIVQNPYFATDNTVTLTFETATTFTSQKLTGTIYVPDSTILHPSTPETQIKQPAEGAMIYMDGFVGQADKNGQFVLKEKLEDTKNAQIWFGINKAGFWYTKRDIDTSAHRALVIYNSNTYVCDVDCKYKNNTPATAEITLSNATSRGVLPKSVTAYSTDVGTYGDTITLVNTRGVNFSVNFDARNISADKPVNLARWSFVGANGIERSVTDTEIKKGSSVAEFSCVLSEKAKQGDKMYVEFFNKSYDSSSNARHTSYGRFEVGYSFVNANIELVTSYMPDIGYYDTDDPAPTGADSVKDSDLASTGDNYAKIPSAPGIGPVSPLFSLYGFMPIYSDAATGQKDQQTGKDLYTLEIGVQFSIVKSQEKGKEGKWDVMSVANQYEKLSKIINKSPGELAQGMHTSTKISLTVTFAYQLEYYTADDGARHYTQSIFLLGAKIGVKISIPFTIVAVPCFVYIDVSVDNIGYIVNVPNKNTNGYFTSKMLDDPYYYDTHGQFAQNFVLKFGIGIGFDGLASIGGHIDFNLESRIKAPNHGKMTFGIKGGIFAELLFLKVDKTWNIDTEVLLDTEADLAAVGANILNENSEDLFKTKLGDMKLARASDIYDDSVAAKKADLASTGADAYALYTNEVYEETNAAEMIPVVEKISDTRYLIATAMNNNKSWICLKAYIYDTEEKKVVEQFRPVGMLDDTVPLTDEERRMLLKGEDLVADIDLVDCGDQILLLWESCTANYSDDLTIPVFLKSFKVMGMLYDKQTGKFTDYSVINDESGRLPDKIKGVYNPETDSVHVFYESIDVDGVDDETTLDQLNKRPISLSVSNAVISGGKLDFSKASPIDTEGKTISDYSASAYGDKVLVSYISAEKNSRIVEYSLTETEYDKSNYGTENAMYLNRYEITLDGTLQEEDALLIADEDHVIANPEFVTLDYQDIENVLLFYKCNGRYGYQNIDNLYLQYDYCGSGNAIETNMMEPEYITIDEDHTVGEDFKVYSGEDGELYALWTLSEGDQQQIWSRQFEVDEIVENDKVAKLDENGQVAYASEGEAQTETLNEPIRILRGYWGNKVKLTTGGIKTDNIGTGFYKGSFDVIVTGKDQLLAAYEAFDYDFGDEREGDGMERINNRFVISEFDMSPYYGCGVKDPNDAVEFDKYYPNPGETVQVTVKAANTGFKNGRDVTLRLRRTGTEDILDTVDYPIWLAGEDKEETFTYTVPEDIKYGKVDLYYDIVDDGKIRYRSEVDAFLHAPRLSIDIAHADPESYFTEDNDSVKYHVTATVSNIGNDTYSGGDELNFIFNDLPAQADVMDPSVKNTDPFYINYGGIEIPALEVGSSVELSFVSDEIPEEIFDKYNTNSANLKLAITPKDGIGWKEVKDEEKYNFLDELGIGQFVKPEPEEVTAITAEPLELSLGETDLLMPIVTPASAAADAQLKYTVSDDKIVSVNENGEVTALKKGDATVTISCGDVKTEVKVTVTASDSLLLGDADTDGLVAIIDATAIQRHLADISKLSLLGTLLADVDRDGTVSIIDATYIQCYLAQLKAPENIGKPIGG